MSGPGVKAGGGMADWVIPRGTHTFNAPIVMEDVDGVTWRGYGGSNVSRLVYIGPPTKGFLQIIGSSRCVLKDFEIVIASPGVESAVLICNRNPANPNGRISTNNLLDNVRVMHGGFPTAAKYAFSVDGPAMGGTSFNNEHHEFRRCQAQSYRGDGAGFHLNGNQAHQTIYDRCIAHDAGGRRGIGLLCEDGAYFRLTNSAFAYNSIDVMTGISERLNKIDCFSSEGSTVFYESGTVGSILSCDGIRWDGMPDPTKPVFKYFGIGPVAIRESQLAGINGVCPRIVIDGYLGSLGSADLSGLVIRQHLGPIPASPLVSVKSSWPIRQHGLKHQHINGSGTITTTPITVNTAQVA